ncbi:MAG TPA: TonB-dependent siderophore receptor [Dongiaceae bacterium]|nr:TonB-dependent siderophore receptor [Dongiaceae bacterium]
MFSRFVRRSEAASTPTPDSRVRPLSMAVHLVVMATAFASAPLLAEQAPVTLEPVDVTAAGLGDPDATEDTQSYVPSAAKTATPLRLSPRETPQSISVVTQQRIEDQDMQTIMDVVNNTTGISVNRYETNRAQFNARGFEIKSLMIDGAPTIWEQPWSSGEVFSSLAMYDRVEIVRGANGLMAGAGDPSASINLVHKRASSKELKGSVEANASRWDSYGGLADVSTALNQTGSIRGRLVGEYNEGDSWVDMLSDKQQTLYGTFDVDLSDDTVLWFGVSHEDKQADSPMWGGLSVWYSDGTPTNWSRTKTTSANWSRWDNTYDNYFVNLEHNFANGWQASFGFSRSEKSADSYLLYAWGDPNRTTGLLELSGDMALFAGFYGGSYDVQTDQDDVNLEISGPFQLLGRSHDLAFGYSHSVQDFNADTRGYLYAGNADLNNWRGIIAEPSWHAPLFTQGSEITQEGLYGVARINLADVLKLIVGTRVSNYEKTSSSGDSQGNPIPADPIEVNDEVTPYAGLIYDLTANLSAYVSYTDIFLPQSVMDIHGNPLEPIIGKSAETGIKGEFIDGRLNTSLSVFRIQQDNLGQSTGEQIPGRPAGTFAYAPADGATSRGFELEVSGELAAGWNATAGYTQFQAQDADGEDVNSLYPRKLLRTFTTYRLPGEWNNLTVGGGWNWQTDIFTYATNPQGNLERIEQKRYSLIDLMARYEFTQQLSAQLNASNVQDTTYFDVFDAYGALTYGEPYNLKASVKYKF